jgi:hypothetical protein
MKKLFVLLSAGAMITAYTSCSDSKDRYVDLSTGQPVELVKDEATGVMVNSETKQPVYIYVDTRNNDTIYGKTGKVINGHVVRTSDNRYLLDEDEKQEISNNAVEYKDGDLKVEVEKDGDIKIKDGDNKKKLDAETGERKVKND